MPLSASSMEKEQRRERKGKDSKEKTEKRNSKVVRALSIDLCIRVHRASLEHDMYT